MADVVDAGGVRRLVEAKAQLVEVLPADEYEWGHLPGARNVPLKQLAGRMRELDRKRPVIVYCHDYQ